MKRTLVTVLLTLVFTIVALPVSAQEVPEGQCPPAFELHEMGHHSGGSGTHGEHKHVGVPMDQVDRNGDGYICVKMVGKGGKNHVHIDNNLPLHVPDVNH